MLAVAADPAGDLSAINSGILDYIKLLAVLGGILLFAFLALRWWLPRMQGARAMASGPIQVAARCSLEPRRNLYIIQAGEEYVLVATSETGVHLLTALDAAQVRSALDAPPPLKPEPEFARLVRALKRSRNSP